MFTRGRRGNAVAGTVTVTAAVAVAVTRHSLSRLPGAHGVHPARRRAAAAARPPAAAAAGRRCHDGGEHPVEGRASGHDRQQPHHQDGEGRLAGEEVVEERHRLQREAAHQRREGPQQRRGPLITKPDYIRHSATRQRLTKPTSDTIQTQRSKRDTCHLCGVEAQHTGNRHGRVHVVRRLLQQHGPECSPQDKQRVELLRHRAGGRRGDGVGGEAAGLREA
jgi:hypothetical protein